MTTTRDESAELRQVVNQLQRACESLTEERAAAERREREFTQRGGARAQQTLQQTEPRELRPGQVKSLKQRLARARTEVKDYEVYRDVMESQMGTIKREMQRVAAERDAALKAAKKLKAAASRRRRVLQAKSDKTKVRVSALFRCYCSVTLRLVSNAAVHSVPRA